MAPWLDPDTFLAASGALALSYVALRARAGRSVAGEAARAPDRVEEQSPASRPARGARVHRATELLALARHRGRAAVPELAACLDDPDPEVATLAAELLGTLGGPEALSALLEADRRASAPAIAGAAAPEDAPPEPADDQLAAADAAPAPPAPAARGAPRQAAPPGPSGRPADLVFEPLARGGFRALHRHTPHDPRDLGSRELATVLLKAGADPDEKPAVRYFAIRNLARFHHPAIRESLVDLLGAPVPLVRYAAAEVLGIHGSVSEGPALVDALSDGEPNVRASAAHSLAAIGTEAAVRPLLELRQDPDGMVRLAAERALAAIGRRHGITRLLADRVGQAPASRRAASQA